MENRFGIKDLILLVLLVALVVVLLLNMKQYDRQWGLLQLMQKQQDEQSTQLQALNRTLKNLGAGGLHLASSDAQGNPATQPSGLDPFARIDAAQQMPGYAEGDAYIMGTAKLEKITPLTTKDTYGENVINRVLESLLTRDPVTLAWQPLVAKSLPKISSDGLTFTFHLRDDVYFSDGYPLTANDVVWTYKWIMNQDVECPRVRAYYAKLRSVVAPDDYTVVFTFAEPYFKSEEIAGGLQIMPEHFYGKFTPEQFNKSPGLLMGSGPYRMEDPQGWTPGKQLKLVRNDSYWGPRAPFNRLVYKEYSEEIGKITDFRNGDIDDPGSLFPEEYRDLLKDSALVARTQHFNYQTWTQGYRYIGWNERRNGKPTRFADKRVRLAMTLLTDRQTLCDQLNDKMATVISGPFFNGNPQADPAIKPWPYDVQRAKDLLKEAGYEDRDGTGILRDASGNPFTFQMIYPSGLPAYELMVKFLKTGYARAGITLEPDPLEWPVFSTKLKNRDFDAITLGWGTGLESDIYQMFSSEQIKDGGDNAESYSNPQLDALMGQARRTMDADARMKLWRQCHRILHEDQPYTFLLTRRQLEFLDGRFKNVQLLRLGINPDLEWFVPMAQQKYH